MADKSTNNIELKVLVDKGNNKVIFIEPENDFLDVLFSFMAIPMGTIIRLARKHSDPVVIGCMNNLYESVENIDEQEFRFPKCKDMLLRPANAADFLCNCLKLKLDNAEPRSYFMCPKLCKFLSYNYGTYCPCSYSSTMDSYNLSTMVEKKSLSVASVFVKRRTGFIVTDDLQVIPPSASTDSVLFTKLGVVDVHATKELAINIGTVEICNLLLSCLVSKTPLTETLMNPEQEPRLRSTILNQGILNEYQMSGDSTDDEEGKISLNLVVSKSKKVVCYAEVGEDFVNLLYSFLTLPLGFIVKNMKDCSLKGCINHLFKTILDLDGQYMISNHHKEMLVNPKLVPAFCYQNSLIGIEETSYYYEGFKLTTDSSSKFNKLKVLGSEDVNAQGFLKGPASFVVTDTLIVRPMSRIFELHVLKDLNVPVTDIENQIVHVGKKEALHLLLASFLCDSALTNTFFGDIKKPKQEQRWIGYTY